MRWSERRRAGVFLVYGFGRAGLSRTAVWDLADPAGVYWPGNGKRVTVYGMFGQDGG